MRRVLAVTSSTALVLGAAVAVAPATSAADLGTVTVSYNPFPANNYTISPSNLNGSGGDTFTLANTMSSVNAWVSLVNSSGGVTLGGTNCVADASCQVVDAGGTATGVFTVATAGAISVRRTLDNGATYSTIGTLMVSGGGGGGTEETAEKSPAPATATMTFDANGGSCSTGNPAVKTGIVGSTYTFPTADECTRDRYTLVGWSFDPRATAPEPNLTPGARAVLTGSGTLYAVWRTVVSVNWTSNECPGRIDNLVSPGESVKLPGVKVCGEEILIGWSLDPELNAPYVYEPGETITVNDNLVLWSKLVPAQSVDLVCSLVAGNPTETRAFAPGRSVSLPQVCDGVQVFTWTTGSDGSGTSYEAGSDVTGLADGEKLYAQTNPTNVTVTWNDPKNACQAATSSVTWGSDFSPQNCTAFGQTLVGWASSPNSQDADLLPGRTLRGDLNAYAVWKTTPVLGLNWVYKCGVEFGSVTWSPESKAFATALPTAADCDNGDYVLMSWNTSADYSGDSLEPGSEIEVSGNRWLYAQWGVPVAFDFGKAECTNTSETVPFGDSYTVPAGNACSVNGEAVKAWSTTNAGVTQDVAPGTSQVAIAAQTYVASWASPVTITFNAGDGTCDPSSVTVGSGGSYSLPTSSECTRENHRLMGWKLPGFAPRFDNGSAWPALWNVEWDADWYETTNCDAAAAPGVNWEYCDRDSASLTGTDLRGADLDNATFKSAQLFQAKMGNASAESTNFSWANLAAADLSGAAMPESVLVGTSAFGAKLSNARMPKANGWLANLAGANLSGADLSGAFLAFANLSGANLANANLSGANLTGANLTDVKAAGANLTGAILGQADMTRAGLGGATLTDANLAGAIVVDADLKMANLTRADLRNLNLSGVDLSGATITDVQMAGVSNGDGSKPANFSTVTGTGADFAGASLAKSNFDGADLTDASFADADLTSASLQRTIADRANFSNVVLRDGTLTGANLRFVTLTGSGVDLRGANFTGADLEQSNLSNASLAGANMTNAKLDRSTFDGTDFADVNLQGARLAAVNLAGKDLSRANVKGVFFQSSNLTDVNLSNRNLTGVWLDYADIGGANFSGARLDAIGDGCRAEGYYINSQVKASKAVLNLPSTWWIYSYYTRRGNGPYEKGANQQWGFRPGGFFMFCPQNGIVTPKPSEWK